MIWKILNDIKSGYHHNKKNIKTKIFKRDLPIIKIFIKLNVINKIIKLKNNLYLIEFRYVNNNKVFVIKNLFRPSNKKIIKLKNLKKSFFRKNSIFIISTNKGVLTTKEAVSLKTGGLLLTNIFC
jgi:ribosomal protein S8